MNDPTTTEGPAFTVPLPDLQTALAALGVVPATRPPVPVLGGVLVEAADGAVTLSVFDYECSARVTVDGAQVKEDGRILLDRADLGRILKGATRGESRKALVGWQAAVTARTTTTVAGPGDKHPGQVRHHGAAEVEVGEFGMPVECLPLDEYPNLPPTCPTTVEVDRDVFAAQLARVASAAGTDPNLPALTGVRVEPGPDGLTLACTNRFNLAAGRVPARVVVELLGGQLLPAAELGRAVKALPAGPMRLGFATAGQHQGLATLTGGGVAITLRLLDAEFPRWRMLIPGSFTATALADRAHLVKAVDKANALAGRIGAVDLRSVDGRLVVTPRLEDADQEKRARGATVDTSCDGDILIGFTGSKLLTALASVGTERVAIGFVSTGKPALFAPSLADLTDEGAEFRHLLMPYGQRK